MRYEASVDRLKSTAIAEDAEDGADDDRVTFRVRRVTKIEISTRFFNVQFHGSVKR
jgi:hypothetical protein